MCGISVKSRSHGNREQKGGCQGYGTGMWADTGTGYKLSVLGKFRGSKAQHGVYCPQHRVVYLKPAESKD